MIARPVLSVLLALACVAASTLPARAQSFPARAITLIVPFAAGGGADAIARIVAESMAKTLGQPVVIENVPGAGGTTATLRLAQAIPDGHTLMLGHMGTHGAAPAVYPNLRYDPAKDFTPVGLTAEQPVAIVARKDFPADTLAAFVDHVRRNQQAMNEAHAGVGSVSHITCTLLQTLIGTRTARVAYRGVGPVATDLVGGQVDFACMTLSSVASQVQAGTIKAFAVASPARASVIAEVPTTIEAGLPDFQTSSWNAFFAPRNLPSPIQAKLNDAVVRALDDAATRQRLVEIGCEIPAASDRTPEALQELVEREVARWLRLLKPPAPSAN